MDTSFIKSILYQFSRRIHASSHLKTNSRFIINMPDDGVGLHGKLESGRSKTNGRLIISATMSF
jgi:hypothetical protein